VLLLHLTDDSFTLLLVHAATLQIAVVNQSADWGRTGSFKDVHVGVIDLRGNVGLPVDPPLDVFQDSSVWDRVLLPSVDICASMKPRYSKADWGVYVGTVFVGTPCP
jgi:hypothetical protein